MQHQLSDESLQNTKRHCQLVAIAKALPEQCVSNEELVKRGIDTSDEWIVQRTGIKQRYIAKEGQTSSVFATEAAGQALCQAGLTNEDIQLIIVATSTPDYSGFPSVACLVQKALKLKNAFAFDVSVACTGFSYALSIAEQYCVSGMVQHALVIAAECLSHIVDWSDRSTCVLFGDGAGAAVLRASDKPGLLASHLGSNGEHSDILSVVRKTDSARLPFYDSKQVSQERILMDGKQVFKLAVETISACIDQTLSNLGLNVSDIKKVVLHQANQRILSKVQERCGFNDEQMVCVVQDYGNTSAASIPIALADIQQQLLVGDKVLLAGFGSGFTWGVTVLCWSIENKGEAL